MNNERRRRLDFCNLSLRCVASELEDIKESIVRLSNLKKDIDRLSSDITEIQERIGLVGDDEWNTYCSLPENLQNTLNASVMFDAARELGEVYEQISSLLDKMDELESIYFSKFMSGYNTEEIVEKIDGLNSAIAECRASIDCVK